MKMRRGLALGLALVMMLSCMVVANAGVLENWDEKMGTFSWSGKNLSADIVIDKNDGETFLYDDVKKVYYLTGYSVMYDKDGMRVSATAPAGIAGIVADEPQRLSLASTNPAFPLTIQETQDGESLRMRSSLTDLSAANKATVLEEYADLHKNTGAELLLNGVEIVPAPDGTLSVGTTSQARLEVARELVKNHPYYYKLRNFKIVDGDDSIGGLYYGEQALEGAGVDWKPNSDTGANTTKELAIEVTLDTGKEEKPVEQTPATREQKIQKLLGMDLFAVLDVYKYMTEDAVDYNQDGVIDLTDGALMVVRLCTEKR